MIGLLLEVDAEVATGREPSNASEDSNRELIEVTEEVDERRECVTLVVGASSLSVRIETEEVCSCAAL